MHAIEFKEYSLLIIEKARVSVRTLLERTLLAARLLPKVARKPAVLRTWLVSAYPAQIAMVVLAVAMWTLVLSAVDARLEKRYPLIPIKSMFGLKKDFHPDPRLEDRKKLARTVLWASSGGIVLFLLLLHIPKTAKGALEVARKRESEADALAASEPSASKLLYASAISLAIDPEYESSLRSKFMAVEEQARKKTAANNIPQTESSTPKGTAQTINLEDMESTHVSDHVAPPSGNDERYVIKKELGRGTMGIVFLAHDSVLDRTIALKQLPTYLGHEERLVARFQQEARALAKLNHPNIVQVYDFIQNREQCWIAMEYVEGEELQETLGRLGVLHPGEVIQLGIQMAEALDYAHEHGVIHRDFKPANVLMTCGRNPKITDFGLAKLVQSSLRTHEGAMLGSPAYMSPEQAQGKPSDARADIYALGVTLFKMITSRFPFEGDVETVLAQKIMEAPPPPSQFNGQIPEAFDRIVTQMLAKAPEARPDTMRACAQALQTLENPSTA
jgi:predicted Ser/Thr protein kinase